MSIEIKIPSVGESITEVSLVKWIKKTGDWVERDEVIAELESEKATFEINAEQAGILQTKASEGDTLKIGDVAGTIDKDAKKPEGIVAATAPQKEKTPEKTAVKESIDKSQPAPDVKATPVAAA